MSIMNKETIKLSPEDERHILRSTLYSLHPAEDSHWVASGVHKDKPDVQMVRNRHGYPKLTRQDIEAAMPGWNRQKAADPARHRPKYDGKEK